jgi:hypothetical protein
MAKPQPLSPDEAKEKILLILNDGEIRPTFHCRRDSMTARNVEEFDIRKALTFGEVRAKPAWDETYQNWKYKVVGKDLEDDKLTVITVIVESDFSLKIITVW